MITQQAMGSFFYDSPATCAS